MRFALLLLMTVASSAPAAFIKSDVCDGYVLSRRGNDLLIYCPPNVPKPGTPAQPWGTWHDAYAVCPALRVRRLNGDLYITCQ